MSRNNDADAQPIEVKPTAALLVRLAEELDRLPERIDLPEAEKEQLAGVAEGVTAVQKERR